MQDGYKHFKDSRQLISNEGTMNRFTVSKLAFCVDNYNDDSIILRRTIVISPILSIFLIRFHWIRLQKPYQMHNSYQITQWAQWEFFKITQVMCPLISAQWLYVWHDIVAVYKMCCFQGGRRRLLFSPYFVWINMLALEISRLTKNPYFVIVRSFLI